MSCIFCAIVAGQAPATVVADWPEAIAIVPLGPVVDGHVLVVPREHVTDAAKEPTVTADTMYRAAQYARNQDLPFNLITSAGPEATQTVFHLHIHYIPRRAGDDLTLPWTGQERAA